jgi:hypothetical protein
MVIVVFFLYQCVLLLSNVEQFIVCASIIFEWTHFGTLRVETIGNTRLGNLTLSFQWSALNGCFGLMRGSAMGNVHLENSTLSCESSPLLRIRRGCGVAFLHSHLSKLLQLIFLCLSSSSPADTPDHSDSKSNNSYLDDVDFDKKVSEILLGFSDRGPKLYGRGEGTFVCPFCCGKKVPS